MFLVRVNEIDFKRNENEKYRKRDYVFLCNHELRSKPNKKLLLLLIHSLIIWLFNKLFELDILM